MKNGVNGRKNSLAGTRKLLERAAALTRKLNSKEEHAKFLADLRRSRDEHDRDMKEIRGLLKQIKRIAL